MLDNHIMCLQSMWSTLSVNVPDPLQNVLDVVIESPSVTLMILVVSVWQLGLLALTLLNVHLWLAAVKQSQRSMIQ